MNKSVYNLDLHETTYVNGKAVMRVPGGWVYEFGNVPVFVPYNNEFAREELGMNEPASLCPL